MDDYSRALSLLERIDDRCARFEKSVLAGHAPDPADYLQEFNGKDREELLYELLRIQFEHVPVDDPALVPSASRLDQRVVERAFADARAAPTAALNPAGAVGGIRVGERLGRYRILDQLGSGGMGTVFVARDEPIGRVVALKVPLIDMARGRRAMLRRFRQEARAAAAIEHPNLCTVLDYGEIDGVPFIAMAYVDGAPLSELLGEGGRVPERQAAALVRRLAEALEETHARGILHRDVKPANVLVTGDRRPVIVDFGLAVDTHAESDRLTATGEFMGTPAYMSPEQLMGNPRAIGPRADVYSLGVLLYRLLTGRTPFIGSPRSILARLLTEDPPPPSDHVRRLDPRIEKICLRAMSRDPDDRFGSMAEFAAELAYYLIESRPADVPFRRQRQADDRELATLLSRTAPLGAGGVPATGTTSTGWWPTVLGFVAIAGLVPLAAWFLIAAPWRVDPSPDFVTTGSVPAASTPQPTAPEAGGSEPIHEGTPGEEVVADNADGVENPVDPAAAPAAGAEPVDRAVQPMPGDRLPTAEERLAELVEHVEGLGGRLEFDDSEPQPGRRPVADLALVGVRLEPEEFRKLIVRLDGLVELRELDLDASEVGDAVLAELADVVSPTTLHLGGTDVTDDGLRHLERLDRIEILDLTFTEVSDAGLVHLAKLPNLRVLDLTGTTIDGSGLGHLEALEHLTSLDLTAVRLDDTGLSRVGRLSRLEFLDLSHVEVTDAQLSHLSGLVQLRSLDLSLSRVGDRGVVHLSGMTQLEHLGLRKTSLTDTGLVRLGMLSTLKFLDVASCPEITETGVQLVEKDLPKDCRIVWGMEEAMIVRRGGDVLTFYMFGISMWTQMFAGPHAAGGIPAANGPPTMPSKPRRPPRPRIVASREEQAQGRLDMARAILDRKARSDDERETYKRRGCRYLRIVRDGFPGTKAARDAEILLQLHGDRSG